MSESGRIRLARALAALTRRERLLLALAHVEGLRHAESARVLGSSPARVARDLELAVGKLERSLEPARRRA